MNYKSLFLGLLLPISALSAQAQAVIRITNLDETLQADSIGEVLFNVQYDFSFVSDTLNADKITEETMVLEVGKQCTKFYSYSMFLTDSIVAVDQAMGASMEVMQQHIQKYSPKVGYLIYKNYPEGKMTTLDYLGMNNFKCEEAIETPKWNIEAETDTILSYLCQRARCHFRGRDYEAWFAAEIPLGNGPWKLHGLPGLILKATDSKGHYSFVATSISTANAKKQITFSGKNAEPISRKNLLKLHQRYMADPIGYITSTSPGVTIKVSDESGASFKPKNLPYNPIELK